MTLSWFRKKPNRRPMPEKFAVLSATLGAQNSARGSERLDEAFQSGIRRRWIAGYFFEHDFKPDSEP
jgi:hypothetical protein